MNNDILLKKCIEQGYVSKKCKLDGVIALLLVQDGKNPCIGCNMDCQHAKTAPVLNKEESIYIQSLIDEEKERNKEHYDQIKRIEKRANERKDSTKGFIFIDTEYGGQRRFRISINVIKPLKERGYIKYFDSIPEAINYLPLICSEYDIEQVFVDSNGYGISISEALLQENYPDIDIVPLKYSGIKL